MTFDSPLAPGPLNTLNWQIILSNLKKTVTTATVLPHPFNRVVRITTGFQVFFPAADSVTYLPPPFDLTSVKGPVPVAEFVGFPLGP